MTEVERTIQAINNYVKHWDHGQHSSVGIGEVDWDTAAHYDLSFKGAVSTALTGSLTRVFPRCDFVLPVGQALDTDLVVSVTVPYPQSHSYTRRQYMLLLLLLTGLCYVAWQILHHERPSWWWQRWQTL